jgi:DNA-binding MurR/RpiR family transcriptional regulator
MASGHQIRHGQTANKDIADNGRPQLLTDLKAAVAKRRLILPVKLESVARVLFAEPHVAAATIARRCRVSPNTVSRLAPRLGFTSFKDMQNFFRDHLVHVVAGDGK